MMCQRMGRPPISTIGLGRNSVSSRRRVPNPPHRTTTFIIWVPGSAVAARQRFVLPDLYRPAIQLSHTQAMLEELRKSPGSLQFEDSDPDWLGCDLWGLITVGEGNVAMAEKAEHD